MYFINNQFYLKGDPLDVLPTILEQISQPVIDAKFEILCFRESALYRDYTDFLFENSKRAGFSILVNLLHRDGNTQQVVIRDAKEADLNYLKSLNDDSMDAEIVGVVCNPNFISINKYSLSPNLYKLLRTKGHTPLTELKDKLSWEDDICTLHLNDGPKILECSTRSHQSLGRKFSAFNAKIYLNGKFQSIEWHYQTAKFFAGKTLDIKSAKGKQPTGVLINGIPYPIEYLSKFYYYLWYVYFTQNKDLMKQASEYERFTDMFRGGSKNCQADCVDMWVRDKEYYLDFISDVKSIIGQ